MAATDDAKWSVEDSVDVTLWLARMIDGKAKCAIVTTSWPADRPTGAMNADSAFCASNWPLIDEACRSSGAAGPRLICCVNSDQRRRPSLQSTHIIVESNEALQTYIQLCSYRT